MARLGRSEALKEHYFEKPLLGAVETDPTILVRCSVWQAFLRAYAFSVRVSMACIEDMHKGMKSKAHKQKTWSNFAAEVINDEYKRMDAVEKNTSRGSQPLCSMLRVVRIFVWFQARVRGDARWPF